MKKFLLLLLLAFTFTLTSCGSSGWSCQKRYVYVDMNKNYITKHQKGYDSYDQIVLNKRKK